MSELCSDDLTHDFTHDGELRPSAKDEEDNDWEPTSEGNFGFRGKGSGRENGEREKGT